MMWPMDRLVSLGIRPEILIPAVAVLSMGAGILVARYTERRAEADQPTARR